MASAYGTQRDGDLLHATRALLGITHPYVLAQRASIEVHRLVGSEFASLALREAPDLLVMRGAYGARTPYVGLHVRAGDGIGGRVLLTGEPVSVANYRLLPETSVPLRRAAIDEGLYAVTGVPLIHRGEILGVLYAGARTPVDLEAPGRACLEELASSLAPLVFAAAHAQANQELSVHEERLRIARELHDSVGQLLYSAGVTLKRVESDASDEAGELKDEVEAAQEYVATAAEQLRTVFRALAPSAPEDELPLLMRMDADSFEARSDTPIEFCIVGEVSKLPSAIELLLLRAEREGLLNVERHAGASSVVLTLHFGTDSVGVVVQDDGAGARGGGIESLPKDRSGWGLSVLRHEVERRGGSLELLNGDFGGAVLRVSVPV
jgi:LuxR family transcriptional regulator, regulator of acetate metabolism